MTKESVFLRWAVGAITPSPFQVRVRFAELEQLAQAMRYHGFRGALICRRPAGMAEDCLELVAGERRLRSAKLAGLTEVMVEVVTLSDEDAEKLVLLENLQREDLTPLEESAGYAGLERRGLTTAEIAAAVGKPLSRIRTYLPLMARCPEVIRVPDEPGMLKIEPAVAALVCGLPTEDLREAFGALCVSGTDLYEGPLTREEARLVRRERFSRSVRAKDVGWDPRDGSLLPMVRSGSGERLSGGACTDCPHRSGNAEPLAVGVPGPGATGTAQGMDGQLCLNLPCWKAKTLAMWEGAQVKARAAGLAVVGMEEAERIFMGPGGSVAMDSVWADIAAVPVPMKDLPPSVLADALWEGRTTWRGMLEMLPGSGAKVLTAAGGAVALHPVTGMVLTLIRRRLAAGLLAERLGQFTDGVDDPNRDGATSRRDDAGRDRAVDGSGDGDDGGEYPFHAALGSYLARIVDGEISPESVVGQVVSTGLINLHDLPGVAHYLGVPPGADAQEVTDEIVRRVGAGMSLRFLVSLLVVLLAHGNEAGMDEDFWEEVGS